jgi:Apea-like HEPN
MHGAAIVTWLKRLWAWIKSLFKKSTRLAPQAALQTPQATPTYAFRIRVNRSPSVTFNSALTRIDFPADQAGIALSLRASSPDRDKSIHDADRWVLIGEGYSSENAAWDAGRLFQDAFILALAKAKVGIDIGVQGPKSGLTKQGEELFSAQYGRRTLSDYHGLAVYQLEPAPQFLTLNATGVVGRNLSVFEQYFSNFITQPPQLGDRERIALHLFHASFFQPPDTRFLLLIMTIEALIVPAQAKSAAAVTYVEHFIATINASELEQSEKASLVGSLRHLKNQSISQSGKRLAKATLGTKTYQGKTPDKFFEQAYDIRSTLVHGTASKTTFDAISNIVGDLEGFVCDLLTAKL